MPTEISLHDNRLLAYAVDGEAECITLHTLFDEREPHERTDVVFTGVAAYHFEGDTFGTILFDIYEAEIEHIYLQYEDLFHRRRNYGWPWFYKTETELIESLHARQIRGFVISATLGMDGFVLAREMQRLSL